MLKNNLSPQQILPSQVQILAKPVTSLSTSKMRAFSHDLASPLTAIKLNLDMLAPATKKKQAEVMRIYKGIDYIESMIEQELTNKKCKKYEQWFVSKIIDEVINLQSSRLAANNISISKKYFCDKSYTKVPAAMFFRVINNLLDNAIDSVISNKSSQKSGAKKRIWIAVRPEADGVVIMIRDNGKGISKKLQKNLFTDQISTKKNGHGLGLVSIKNILQLYFNGRISYRNNNLASSGAVFEVFIQ